MPDLKPTSLDTALEHIDEGRFVFPVRANKAPACKHGFNAAVNTPEEAEQLWRGKDAPLLGIDCGRSNIWVLNIDPDGLGWLDENRDIIPDTQYYKTPRGGFHYVFAGHPAIRNSSNKISNGVDVRGIGGYVCRGNGYDIIHDADVAEASPELIHLALEANSETASFQAPAPAAPTKLDVWGKIKDGREAKMAEMVYAKCMDAVREVDFDEAYDRVVSEYPDYERLVAPRGASLEADGRGLSEWKKKTKSTLAKFEREGLPELRRQQPSDRPNEPVVFNMIDDELIRVSDGQTYKRTAFQAGTGRKLTQEITDGLIEVVDGTVFEPAAADTRVICVNGKKMFNTYPVCPVPVADSNHQGHPAVDLIVNHVIEMFGDDADFVLDWLAYQVQHYGEKLRFVVVVVGVQGDGKTMMFDKLPRALVGYDHVRTVSPVQVNEAYNDWAVNTGLVTIEELTLQGTTKSQVMEQFKPLVTNDTIAISEKYKNARQVRNTANFVILTNHKNALPIASDDRRFHVLKTSTETRSDLPLPSHFNAMHKTIDNHADILRGYFLDHDLKGFNVNQPPPSTSAKDLMREMQLYDEQLWVKDVLQNPERGYRQECFSLSVVRAHLKEEHGYTLPPRNTEVKLGEIGYVKYGQLKFDNKNHTIYLHRDLKAGNPSADRIREMLEHPTSEYSNYDQDEFPV